MVAENARIAFQPPGTSLAWAMPRQDPAGTNVYWHTKTKVLVVDGRP